MKLSLPLKFALLSFIITLIGVIGVAWRSYSETDQLLQQEAIRGLSMQMEREIVTLEKQGDQIRKDVFFLLHSEEIRLLEQQISKQGSQEISGMELSRITSLFTTLMNQREIYYQVRLIGVADGGRELVRVARLNKGITAIAKDELQQKAGRDYFRNSISLKRGEFLFSDISLNREHGRITQPPRPMLRVSTALFDSAGKVYAILLINVDIKQFTASLQNQQNFFIANRMGDYLIHHDAEKAMAFEYQRQARVQTDYELTDEHLQAEYEHHGTVIQAYLFDTRGLALQLGKIHFNHDHPDRFLQVGATVELQQLRAQSIELRDRMLWLTLLLALFLGLVTYLFARMLTRPIEDMIKAAVNISEGQDEVLLPAKTHDEIGMLGQALQQMLQHLKESRQKTEALNVALEVKVSKRTAELGKLAETLELQNVKLEQALLNAEQAAVAKSQFLATMSHEIRTPLNGVLGLTELVLATELTGQQRENLKTVQSSGDTLLTILNDILDFSKIEAGLMEMKPVEFNPNEVVEHVAKLFSGRLNQSEHTLELITRGIAHMPNLLIGDSDRLHQVMMNLMSNAVKFTERGEILIAVDVVSESSEQLCVKFQVHDSGTGISQDDQAGLFEEFTQADGTDTRKHGGTGLGLAIVKRLVELMGGEIEIESEPGKGSSFFFELSLEKAATVVDGPHAYHDHFKQWHGMVVDDNATNRSMLHDILDVWGMDCATASCGSSALKELRKGAASDKPYDVILIDQLMQGMDGMALARVIKESPELSGLKVIMTTSLDMSFDAHIREQYGLDGYIRKPVYMRSLFETVLSVMGVRERMSTGGNSDYAPPVQRKERILLAEDNTVNQQVAVGMLGHQGFMDVDVAHNGLEALELFAQHSYALIFMDVQMPELDGLAATREIRELEQFSEQGGRVPIIALTAHALEEDRQRVRDAGMDDHLSKPLTGKALHEMLAHWLPLDGKADIDKSAVRITDADIQAEAINDAAIDEQALRQLRRDMGFGIGMILDTYTAELPKQIECIIAAITAEDADALRRSGHKLKGSSRSVAATALGETCYQLEQLGEQGDFTAAGQLVELLKRQASLVEQGLAENWLSEIR